MMELTEAFHVAYIIRSYLKHKRKEITMIMFLKRINVQEQYMHVARGVPIGSPTGMTSAKANVMEHEQSLSINATKGKKISQKYLIWVMRAKF